MKEKKMIILLLIITLLLSNSIVYAKTNNKKLKPKNIFHVPIIPQKGVYISSPYGYRIHPITRKRAMHWGIDIAAPVGTFVYALADGEVIMARGNGKAGNEIKIDHGNGLQTRFLHMDKRTIKVGSKVRTGQVIGTVGDTGRVTGPHLHFEVKVNGRTVNPTTIFNN